MPRALKRIFNIVSDLLIENKTVASVQLTNNATITDRASSKEFAADPRGNGAVTPLLGYHNYVRLCP